MSVLSEHWLNFRESSTRNVVNMVPSVEDQFRIIQKYHRFCGELGYELNKVHIFRLGCFSN